MSSNVFANWINAEFRYKISKQIVEADEQENSLLNSISRANYVKLQDLIEKDSIVTGFELVYQALYKAQDECEKKLHYIIIAVCSKLFKKS